MTNQDFRKHERNWAFILTLAILFGSQGAWAKVYSVQLGSFERYQNAQKQLKQIKKTLPPEMQENLRVEKKEQVYIVKMGKTEDREQALKWLLALKPYSPEAFVIQTEGGPDPIPKKKNPPRTDDPTLSALPRDQVVIVAAIREISKISSEQLGLPPGKNVTRLVVRVEETKAVDGSTDLLREKVGGTLTIFSETSPPYFQPGNKINAIVEYRGNRLSRFYWINKSRIVKP
jgi:hypothetical protein